LDEIIVIKRDTIVSEFPVSIDMTITQMKRLIDAYWTDVSGYSLHSLEDIFDFVRNIPYVKDVDQAGGNGAEEVVMRPEFAIQNGSDCDDKTVLMASFLKNAGYQWRIVTVSYNPSTLEHVHTYAEVLVDGQWMPMDATYEQNMMFYEHPYSQKKVW
jgi:transglutaminase-like putative cysteine protease